VTPFTRDESLDETAFRPLIQYCLTDVDGLVPCGTAGEFPYLKPHENKRLVEIAAEKAQSKPVIAGTGAESTRRAVDLAVGAMDAGDTAHRTVTPHFSLPGQGDLPALRRNREGRQYPHHPL
jgi:4-hydroxy-tetrahydrodipicolinate synthase